MKIPLFSTVAQLGRKRIQSYNARRNEIMATPDEDRIKREQAYRKQIRMRRNINPRRRSYGKK